MYNFKAKMQVVRGTASSLPILNIGELGYATDTNQLFIGDPEHGNVLVNSAVKQDISDLNDRVDKVANDIYLLRHSISKFESEVGLIKSFELINDYDSKTGTEVVRNIQPTSYNNRHYAMAYYTIEVDCSKYTKYDYYLYIVNNEYFYVGQYNPGWYLPNIGNDTKAVSIKNDSKFIDDIYLYPKTSTFEYPSHHPIIKDPSNLTVAISINNATNEQEVLDNAVFNTLKVYKLTIEKNSFNDKYNDTEKFISILNERYGETYELKYEAVCVFNEEVNNYNSKYKNFITFNQSTNCIIDFGDGTIQDFSGTKVEHQYNKGEYVVKVFAKSSDYLNYKNVGGMAHRTIINKMDISQHTSIEELFENYDITINCDIKPTNKITNMASAFISSCGIINVDNFDFSNVTTFDNTFDGSSQLDHLPDNMNTSKVSNWNYAFQQCVSLERIPYLLNTSAATTANGIFYTANSLKYIPELDFRNVTTLKSAFEQCYLVPRVKIITSSKLKDISLLCYDCYELESIETIDLSSVLPTIVTPSSGDPYYKFMRDAFFDCFNLKHVKFSGTATKDVIEAAISQLPEHEDSIVRTVDISLCTNKDSVTISKPGWTIDKQGGVS